MFQKFLPRILTTLNSKFQSNLFSIFLKHVKPEKIPQFSSRVTSKNRAEATCRCDSNPQLCAAPSRFNDQQQSAHQWHRKKYFLSYVTFNTIGSWSNDSILICHNKLALLCCLWYFFAITLVRANAINVHSAI